MRGQRSWSAYQRSESAVSTDRDCTCVGSCRGAGGLAPGWRCALAAGMVKIDVTALVDRAARAHASAALTSLGQQLTIAAGLCEAYRLYPTDWRPGCGRSAP